MVLLIVSGSACGGDGDQRLAESAFCDTLSGWQALDADRLPPPSIPDGEVLVGADAAELSAYQREMGERNELIRDRSPEAIAAEARTAIEGAQSFIVDPPSIDAELPDPELVAARHHMESWVADTCDIEFHLPAPDETLADLIEELPGN